MITKEQKAEITRLHAIGVLIKNMPQLVGVSVNQVRDFLNSRQFRGKPRNFKWDTIKLRFVSKRIKDGLTVREIAEEMNVKTAVIQRAILAHVLREW